MAGDSPEAIRQKIVPTHQVDGLFKHPVFRNAVAVAFVPFKLKSFNADLGQCGQAESHRHELIGAG
jgi:hypothetical protein